MPHFLPDRLERPCIGNPYGYTLNDKFISACADYQYYYSEKIRFLLRAIKSPSILEIGGGFGGLAYFLSRDIPKSQYLGFDLPEITALASYYLMAAFPEKKFTLYGELELDEAMSSNVDFILMPNFEINKVKNETIDLSFNSYSLAEMDHDAIFNYIKIICSATKKYFLHLNHCKYAKMSADQFPIDYDKFFLLSRSATMWGKVSNRNPEIDEHEFIYERI